MSRRLLSWLRPATASRPVRPRHRHQQLMTERLESRDNPSGVFDPTFDVDGRAAYFETAATAEQAFGVAVQRDGKIVTVGSSANNNDFLVMRSLANGKLDTAFATGGHARFTFGGTDVATDVAIQADGKIVVVGHTTIGGDFAVARLNADGTLDTTFDTDGLQTIDFGGVDKATGVVLQADVKIVVGGYTANNNDFALARLNANGSLDATFDTDGKFAFSFGGVDVCNDIALQSDGKFVLAGTTDQGGGTVNNFGIARVNAAGGLDTTFDTDGLVTIDFGNNDSGSGVALQPDGRIVVAGTRDDGSADFAVARLNANGSLDTTFDTDGKMTHTLGGVDIARSVAVHAGKIVIAGNTSVGANPTNGAVMRLTSAGAVDTSFDVDGHNTFDFGGADDLHAVAVDRTGRIVAAGHAVVGGNDDFALARVTNSDTAYAGRTSAGQWWVATGLGTDAGSTLYTTWNEAAGWRDVRKGDFNGDGLADVAGRTSAGQWWVGVNTGTGFTNSLWTTWNEAANWRDVRTGDFNGDGRTDLAGRTDNGQWWVGTSNGTTFANTKFVDWNESAGWRDVQVGDFNGDGQTDVAGRGADGKWQVGISTGTAFTNTDFGTWNEAANWRDVRFGDFNGDGRTDVAGRTDNGQWWVGTSNGTTFANTRWAVIFDTAWHGVEVGDFNGDGRADLAGRTSTGQWWVNVSNDTGTRFTPTYWTTWNEAAGWRDVNSSPYAG